MPKKTTEIVILDGIPINIEPPDLDGDGETGGIEIIQQDTGIQPVMQPTELGETLELLNRDEIEKNTGMTSIDMRARLHPVSVPFHVALDTLVTFGVVPQRSLAFTRQHKRLSVSIKGLGRKEIVDLVGGKKEQDAKMAGGGGFGDKLRGVFGHG